MKKICLVIFNGLVRFGIPQICLETVILNTYGQIAVAKKNLSLDTTAVFLITV